MATKRDGQGRRSTADTLRNEQVVRVLHIMTDLIRAPHTLYELADRYGATTRTIRRDLEALTEAGVIVKKDGPGAETDDQRGRWVIDTRSVGALGLLDASHWLALRLAMDEGRALKQAGSLYATLEELSERVEKALGTDGRRELKAINACVMSWEKFAWQKAPPDVLWKLVHAIREKHLCRVTYRAPSSGNKEKAFPVLPLKLFVYNGTVYVHAWQPKFDTVLLLNLHRLGSLQVLDETRDPPAKYNAAELEASAFGIFIGPKKTTYRLRFDAAVAPYILERTWHPRQTLSKGRDGSVELSFTCADSYEVPSWVASWRQHVEVLEPKALREEMKAYGGWLAQRY